MPTRRLLPGRDVLRSRQALVFGHDDTPGIVSVTADRRGHARVWRRVGGRVLCEEDSFPNWLLLSCPELLHELSFTEIGASAISERTHLPDGRTYVARLDGDHPFRFLVLTDCLDEVEACLMEAARRAIDSGTITQPLANVIYVRPPVEQYLTITGRTYFKGMAYADVRRLQFDLETTGLGPDVDQIFMVSIKDSAGFAATLDVETMSEVDLIRALAQTILDRDPDIIENHNVFDFDIRFLLKRAQALAIALPLGRDGTGFVETRDSVPIGGTGQSFTRYILAGREIVDTLHATRRFRETARDLPSSGLKEAARYLGVASDDREYINGAEIWKTFQQDPERVRRYCWDDVEEVDRLSQLLLAAAFALASVVPKPYERLATTGTGRALVEPLLVRAYLTAQHSLPTSASPGPVAVDPTVVFTTGVVDHVVRLDVASLYPSIMLSEGIGPSGDLLEAFSRLLSEVTEISRDDVEQSVGDRESASGRPIEALAVRSAMKDIVNSFYGVLSADACLFADRAAADRVAARGQTILNGLLDEMADRSARLIEANSAEILFGMPPRADGASWTREGELAFVADLSRILPEGAHLEHGGRYRALYSYGDKNYAFLRYEEPTPPGFRSAETVRLMGASFRSPRMEPYVGRFLRLALQMVLEGRPGRVRALYREECARLHAREVPVADLCISASLSKTPQAYLEGERKEEPYEVYLAAGYTAWQTGTRIQYYQTPSGKRLFSPGVTDYDASFYAGHLRQAMMARLDRALSREDLEVILSEQDGLFDPPMDAIRTVCGPPPPDQHSEGVRLEPPTLF